MSHVTRKKKEGRLILQAAAVLALFYVHVPSTSRTLQRKMEHFIIKKGEFDSEYASDYSADFNSSNG